MFNNAQNDSGNTTHNILNILTVMPIHKLIPPTLTLHLSPGFTRIFKSVFGSITTFRPKGTETSLLCSNTSEADVR